MSNYRRYSRYQRGHGSEHRSWKMAVWTVVGIILIVLVWQAFSGSGNRTSENEKNEVTLANTTGAVNSSANVALGPEITTKDCATVITQATTTASNVALTLDAGGTIVGDASEVLNVIKQKQIPVTLFVTGGWATQNAALVKSYSDAGVTVLNHGNGTTSYVSMLQQKESNTLIAADVEQAETAIKATTGTQTKPYLRPPRGEANAAVVSTLRSEGYCTITWTIDAQDGNTGATVQGSDQRVVDHLKKGAIVRMLANSDIAPALISQLADDIIAKGYTLVSLRDLLRRPPAAATANANTANP